MVAIRLFEISHINYHTVLLVTGCETACPRRSIDFGEYKQTVTIRDDKQSPEDLVKILLESEGANED
jgi:hypothetical protein